MLYYRRFSVPAISCLAGLVFLVAWQTEARIQSSPTSSTLGNRVQIRTFYAPSLQRKVEYSIYLPPSYGKQPGQNFPVIYFLHGMNNHHTSWTQQRYGGIPDKLEVLLLEGAFPEFLLVHPHGGNSFYSNSYDGRFRYEDYIRQDLIQEIEGNFRVQAERGKRALAGTSMGGYGALKIAMKHPQLFSSVAAGSPVIFLGNNPLAMIGAEPGRAHLFRDRFTRVFGDPLQLEHWRQNSIEVLARTADLRNLRIYLAYGTADRYDGRFPMREGIETLDRILSERNVPHFLRIFPGEPHGWRLIADHLQEIFTFLTATF